MRTEYEKRGYKVLENGPVYYTKDMDRTIEWFETVLGWYGTVDARDENGNAIFGGIAPIPNEITETTNLTYLGFSLLEGEPTNRVVAYFVVDDARAAYEFMLKSGWKEYTEIMEQPWGGMEFRVRTIDGSLIRIASY
ncbi:VOC family protein [Anaerosporobacter faecicola]|uniref:VOC family protein n=1 Tax=Anaerosporobacter faecicola TaxID=2718714 RepID=UPI00143AB390|nr:VOC family protein [Anaerosporobacter faecicola]